MTRNLIKCALPLALLTVVAGGCGSTSAEADADPKIRSKIEGIFQGSATIQTAQDLLVSECMAAAGYPYSAQSKSKDVVLRSEFTDDVAYAKENGYGLEELLVSDDEFLAAEGEPDAERNLALFGSEKDYIDVTVAGEAFSSPGTGCVADAQKSLFGSVEDALVITELQTNTLRAVLYNAGHADDVQDVLDDWAECMSDRGYSGLRERNSAKGQATAGYDELPTDQAVANEKRIAVDDAECDREVGYTKVARHAEDVALTTFLHDNEAMVTHQIEAQRSALVKAREVLR